jgi:hypothetical protein
MRGISAALGYDPGGHFRCLAISAPSDVEALVHALTTHSARGRGTQSTAHRGDELLLLDQGGDLDAMLRLIETTNPEASVGIGAPRHGLSGAALSIGDAQRALAVAIRMRRSSEFERDWHAATVLASERRLLALLEVGVDVASRNPDLARTVRVFADNGFSLSAAARTLHVHTNTVAYRLARWTELTGWDARECDGFLRSIAALSLVGYSGNTAPNRALLDIER